MSTRSPNMAQVIQAALENLKANMHTCMIGEVVSYDVAKNTAEIKLVLGKSQFDEDGNELSYEYPNITNVPVQWSRSGGYGMRMPVDSGDTCLVLFGECDLEEWLESGKFSYPEDDRRFDLNDAIAIMGVFDSKKESETSTPSSELGAGLVIGKDGGDDRAFFGGGQIELGGQGSAFTASIDEKVQTELGKYYTHAGLITIWQGVVVSAVAAAKTAADNAGAATDTNWKTFIESFAAAMAANIPPIAPVVASTASTLVKIKK